MIIYLITRRLWLSLQSRKILLTLYLRHWIFPFTNTQSVITKAIIYRCKCIWKCKNNLVSDGAVRQQWQTRRRRLHNFQFPSIITGLLDTITSTAESKDCPGTCVHAIATLICAEVLDDVQCPSPSMRCCLESPANGTTPAATGTSNTGSSYSTTTAPALYTTSKPYKKPSQVIVGCGTG